MRRLLRAAVVGLAVAGAIAAPAAGQIPLPGFGPTSTTTISTTLPATISGLIRVDFASDPATGCAAFDGCAYHGELLADVTRTGRLNYDQARRGAAPQGVRLELGAPEEAAPLLYESVERDGPSGPAGTCADVALVDGTSLLARPVGADWTVPLSIFVGTPPRCAAPLLVDLAALVPRPAASAAELARGGFTLDYRTTRHFAIHGFAGTLTSTVVVRIGRPQRVVAHSEPQGSTARYRAVAEQFTATGVTGSLAGSYTGVSDAGVCAQLDSCGLAGTVTVTPSLAGGEAYLEALGPASLPERDFRVALGLLPGRPTHSIVVIGFATWSGGTASSRSSQAGSICTDTARTGPDTLELSAGGPPLFGISSLLGTQEPIPRTRCPGPVFEPAAGSRGRIQLTPRHLIVTLAENASFGDDGYTATLHGALRFVFRRGRLTEATFDAPAGS